MDKEDVEPQALLDKKIIANVFKYFSARDLAIVSCVCQSWHEVATSLSDRIAVQTMVVPVVCSSSYSAYEFRDDQVYSLIYQKSHLADFLKMKPQVCLVFQDTSYPMRMDYSNIQPTDHLYYRKQLPNEAKYFHISASALMFDSWMLYGHWNLSFAMFLSSIPDLSVEVCVIDYVTTVNFNKKFDSLSDEAEEVLLTDTNYEPACLLLFTSTSEYRPEGSRFSSFIFENLMDRYSKKSFRLWGGQVSNIAESNADDLGVFLMGIRLSGPLLKCWTYVMRKGLAFNEYEEKFYSIKNEIRLTLHSMALVMAPVHEDYEDLESVVQESYEDVFNLCEDMFPDLKFFYLFQTKGDVFSDAELTEDADLLLKYKNSIAFLFLSYG